MAAIKGSMQKFKSQRETMQALGAGLPIPIEKKKSYLETHLVKSLFAKNIKREVTVLEEAANALEMKIHYDKRFKQREIEHNMDRNVDLEPEIDPRIKLMHQCEKNLNTLLPIFDKIVNKTLCLQNYQLNDGHVKGIAQACQFFDHTKINRLLFNNCGLSGD